MDASRLTPYRGLILALAVAAALQIWIAARTPTISADGILFIGIARDLPRAPLETLRAHDQHPGYSVLLLAAASLIQTLGYRADPQSWMLGGIFVSFVCGLASVWVVWLMARELFDARIANVAAIIFAVLPLPRNNAADSQSDTAHLLFYVLAAWLASTAIAQARWRRLAAAGAASGIAYWIRPEGLEVFLVALACLVWQTFRAGWSWRQATVACGALTAAALVVATPYPILSGKITSKQLPFAKAEPVQPYITQLADQPLAPAQPGALPPVASVPGSGDSNPVGSPASASTPNVKSGYSAALVLRLLGNGFVEFLKGICQGFKFVFIPVYLVGFVELVRRKPDGMAVAFISLLAATHIAILLGVFVLSGYIAHRHVLPLVGLAMPFTALGVVYLGDWIVRLPWIAPRYAVPLALAVPCAIVLPHTMRIFNHEFLPVIEASRWVSEHAPPGVGVVSNSPYVPFYGKLPVVSLDTRIVTLDDALAKAPAGMRYEFAVLHVGAHGYRDEWLTQIEAHYQQVRAFEDPNSTTKPKRVLIFQAKEAQARKATHDPRS